MCISESEQNCSIQINTVESAHQCAGIKVKVECLVLSLPPRCRYWEMEWESSFCSCRDDQWSYDVEACDEETRGKREMTGIPFRDDMA